MSQRADKRREVSNRQKRWDQAKRFGFTLVFWLLMVMFFMYACGAPHWAARMGAFFMVGILWREEGW